MVGLEQSAETAARKPRIVIGTITLEEPRIIIHTAKVKEKPERPILELLPSVRLGDIAKGYIELELKDSLQLLAVQEGNLTVRDFSPETGGKLSFSGGFHYTLPDKRRIEIKGSGSGNLMLSALMPKPVGAGTVSITIEEGIYGPVLLTQLAAQLPFSVRADEIRLKAAGFSMGALEGRMGQQAVNIKDVRFRGDVVYQFMTGTIEVSELNASLPPVGEFSGSFSAIMKEPLVVKASLATPSFDLAKIYDAVKPYLPSDYQKWNVQGKATAQTEIQGTYSKKAFSFNGNHRITVTGGGLSAMDGSKAVQGTNGKAAVTFGYSSLPQKLEFASVAELSGGEFLWGTYYNDFSAYTARADASGNIQFEGKGPFDIKGKADVFGAGNIAFSASGQNSEQTYEVDGKEISFKKVDDVFLDSYIKQNLPSLAGHQIGGSSSFNLKILKKGRQTDISGHIIIDDTSLTIPAQNISISGMRLNLPFSLGYPKAMSSGKAQPGFLEIKSAEKDRIKTRDVRIPLLLWGNKLQLPEDAIIHVARGDFMINGFAADDILSPERKISCGIRVNNVSLRPIQRSFTVSPITSTISADYPKVEYYRDTLTAGGITTISIFDGQIEMGDVSIERLASASRKIDTSISFRDINLQKMTEKIAIGKITGVIQGSLRGFEMEYGQPTRFILDIDSVGTKGASQRISVEAIESISILGSGSGMSGVLNRGILSFFKDYPYSRIGIQVTLKNDNFAVHGKIHDGSTEYLVKRGFLRGIDVVNQNPDNRISFKDMEERLKRIFESRKAGGAPVVQ